MKTYIGNRHEDVFTAEATDNGAIAFGRRGEDILTGSNAGDYLFGGRCDDILFGGSGGDYLYGGRGRDYLDGGPGDDFLKGGKGKDLYVIRLGISGFDTIKGFEPGKDMLSFVVPNAGYNADLSYDADTGIVSSNGVPVVWIGYHPHFDI